MNKELNKYTINNDSQLIFALKKINQNNKGFLIVLDDEKVCGVITDGDIRRNIIKNKELKKTIKTIYSKSFIHITTKDGFKKVVENFKDENIKFLPILNENNELINIITKENLHTLLLQNIEYNPHYDFDSLNDSILEHEIYPRPWGFYKTAILSDFCQCKIITIKPNSSISLQKHLRREEHWIIVNGHGEAIIEDEKINIKEGTHLHIPKNTIHRLINTSDSEFLILTEVQLGDYFGEDDIIRIEDEYNRVWGV